MSGALPSRINPFRLAEQGARIEGAVPLTQLHRLAEALISHEGAAHVSLCFAREHGGLSFVTGQLRARLDLQCQRCLGSVNHTVDRRFRLAMVASDVEAERLQSEHEVWQIEEETVLTTDLVEDELLLSMPLVPVHQGPACDAVMLDKLSGRGARAGEHAQQPAHNPFAMLKDLTKG